MEHHHFLYLVVHPTNRKWVSSPQLYVDIAPIYPIYNQGCFTHQHDSWVVRHQVGT